MKYIKTLLVFAIILITFFLDSKSLTIGNLIIAITLSILLTTGVWFFQNLFTSSFNEIKSEFKKTTYKVDLTLIFLSSICLFYSSPKALLIVWIVIVGLTLYLAIPYLIAIRNTSK